MYKYFFFCIFLFLTTSYSQPQYTIRLTNGQLIDDYTYQFDVIISSQEYFEVTSYQCVFAFYCNNMETDNYSLSYVEGSSQLRNKPILGLSAKLQNNKVELTFASKALSDMIGNTPLRVGTFQVKREKETYDAGSIFLNWNFSGNNITILTGNLFADITIPSNFVSDMKLTDINEITNQTPEDYNLAQNYPNPFNPTTRIKFYLKQGGKVVLDVYNMIGQKVAELINQELPSGFHEIEFNASDLASGVYIYRLNVGNKFTSVKKMILEK
ncbi:MAG: T9SS type A sorting domain-containing protein [Ignavibacteriaceae bacterium]